MKNAIAVRQGDVMLFPASVPSTAKQIALRPLAYGEKTGHHHSLAVVDGILDDCAELYESEDGTIYCRILDEKVLLTHQEHKTHGIQAGDYQVVIQQENTDWGSRAVLD